MSREVAYLYSLPLKERRTFLTKSLKDLGLRFDIQHFSEDGYIGQNILVYDYYEKGRSTIIISSHYDGFGAYDNAGGVVALLWIIRWAKRINQDLKEKFSILFVFLDGEERGLLGAKHFVKNNSINEIYGHISLDGFGIGTEIGCFANLKEARLKVNSQEKSIKLQADTTVFQKIGVLSLHLFTLPEKELLGLLEEALFPDTWRIVHTKNDTPDKIDDCLIPFMALNFLKNLRMIDFQKNGIIALRDNYEY
jgi:hypothetical protein